MGTVRVEICYDYSTGTGLDIVDGKTLPGLDSSSEGPSLDGVFDGLSLQRLRLKRDQQVPEWLGPWRGRTSDPT